MSLFEVIPFRNIKGMFLEKELIQQGELMHVFKEHKITKHYGLKAYDRFHNPKGPVINLLEFDISLARFIWCLSEKQSASIRGKNRNVNISEEEIPCLFFLRAYSLIRKVKFLDKKGNLYSYYWGNINNKEKIVLALIFRQMTAKQKEKYMSKVRIGIVLKNL